MTTSGRGFDLSFARSSEVIAPVAHLNLVDLSTEVPQFFTPGRMSRNDRVPGNQPSADRAVDRFSGALVMGPGDRDRQGVRADVTGAPVAGGGGGMAGSSVAEELGAMNIHPGRTDLLPEPLPMQPGMGGQRDYRNDFADFLGARNASARQQALAQLRARCEEAERPGCGGPGGANYIHARRAYEQALLFDGAIRLRHTQAAMVQAMSGTATERARAERDHRAAILNLVRLEGNRSTNATNFLNGFTESPVVIGDERARQLSEAEVQWVRTARARDAGFALELFSPQPGQAPRRTNLEPADYEAALSRLLLMSSGANPNQRAIQALARLEPIGAGTYLQRLRSSDQSQVQSTMREIERRISGAPASEVSVAQLLRGVNPDLVRQAQMEEEETVRRSIRAVAQPLEGFVTRTEGGAAAPAQNRARSIEAVRAASRNANLDVQPLLEWMETADFALRLHESATPQAAATALRSLLELAGRANQPNVRASHMVVHLGGEENVRRLVERLEGRDNGHPPARVLEELLRQVSTDHILQRCDDFLLRCRTAALPERYSSADLERVTRDLTMLPRSNRYVQSFLDWVRTEAVLKKIEESGNDRQRVLVAVRELTDLVQARNRFALSAAAGLLLDPQDLGSWRLLRPSRRPEALGERPLTLNVLEAFGRQNPGELNGMRLSLARSLASLPADALTENEYAAMALAASYATSHSDELSRTLVQRLQLAVTDRQQSSMGMNGVVDAIRLRRQNSADRTNVLSELYLCGVDAGFSAPATTSFCRWAREDRDGPSIRILAGLAAGYGSGDRIQADQMARNGMLELVRNPALRNDILAALRQVAEPRVERAESTYNPEDFERCENLAALHDYMSLAYRGLRTEAQQRANRPSPEEQAHVYEATEIRRVAAVMRSSVTDTDTPSAIYNWLTRLPQRMEVRNAPGLISVGGNRGVFETVAEAVPGFRLSRPLRDGLHGLERLSIEGNRLTIAGRSTINIPGRAIGMPQLAQGLNISLNNVQADLRIPEENVLELTNVRGLSILGMQFNENVRLRVDTSDAQNPRLHLETRLPAAILALVQLMDPNAAANINAELPISREQATQLTAVIQELRRPRAQDRNYQRLATSLSGLTVAPELAPIIGDVQSVTRDGDRFNISRQRASQLSIGELRINLPATMSVELSRQGDTFTLTDRSEAPGITATLPLPGDVLERLGVAADMRITGITLGERNRHGQRRLTIRTDSILQEVSVNIVERDGQLNLVENQGRMEVSTRLRFGDGVINANFAFNAREMARGDILRTGWSLNVSGDQAARRALLERFGIPDFIAEGVQDVTSITHRDGTFDICREGRTPSTISRDGLEITVDQRIRIGMTRQEGRVLGEDVQRFDFTVSGINLARLAPEGLPEVYAHTLPAPLRRLRVTHSRLGSMISIPQTGPIRGADFLLDRTMDVQSGTVVLQHPTNPRTSLRVELRNRGGTLEVDNTAEIVLQAVGGLVEQVGREVVLPAVFPPAGIIQRLLR